MAFTEQQTEEIKKQLLEQIEKLPQENKEQIKEYIKNLDEKSLEEFLKKNKIKYSEPGISQETEEEKEVKCVFCQISKNEIPSYKILENRSSIAILEINPLSKGHSIILPLKHLATEEIPKSAMSLAQKISKKIKKKLKPDDIKIETSNFQGHSFINIVPIYKDIPLKKTHADEKELKQLQKKLETKKRIKSAEDKTQRKKSGQISKIPEIRFRIP